MPRSLSESLAFKKKPSFMTSENKIWQIFQELSDTVVSSFSLLDILNNIIESEPTCKSHQVKLIQLNIKLTFYSRLRKIQKIIVTVIVCCTVQASRPSVCPSHRSDEVLTLETPIYIVNLKDAPPQFL